MTVSVFDLFKVGVGPSSSHTVGPMRAAARFVQLVGDRQPASLAVDVFGSLAATGAGHRTFDAILAGLEGCEPEKIQPEDFGERTERIEQTGVLRFGDKWDIEFGEKDMVKRPLTVLDHHTNALTIKAEDADGGVIAEETYYSVGGGFVVSQSELDGGLQQEAEEERAEAPYPFTSGAQLLEQCRASGLEVWQVMLENEKAHRSEDEIRAGLLHIYSVMEECEKNSVARDGILPGGLNVHRRAHKWYQRLLQEDPERRPEYYQEWVNLVALAVNEENASAGRVVTAPTNGAAGIIPAVMFYALNYVRGVEGGARHGGITSETPMSRDEAVVRFMLTAGAIGVLYKERASISGAEVGCQGEVGSASSMAAAGLAAVLGGGVMQVENAAEIAMEHNLGLTCDPINGLVQIPCIERNAIASGKAINAAKMAMWGDGTHRVSLDEVIATMKATGEDMMDKYKETAMGGLAVNVVEC